MQCQLVHHSTQTQRFACFCRHKAEGKLVNHVAQTSLNYLTSKPIWTGVLGQLLMQCLIFVGLLAL